MTTQPDTIAAVSTAPGPGAIAVVRMSGSEAGRILTEIAPELEGVPEPRVATLVRLVEPESGEAVDRGLVTWFQGPDSYTGQDLVEISCHGGWLAPTLVLDACLAAGARQAESGEFTRRAYLNGKMDLVQAEAVLDLVEGRSRALHTAAVHQLERGLSERIGELREGLIRLEALLTHHIDFPEEDEPPVPVERVADEARELAEALEGLLETAPEGEMLREGALTVLAGRPNSGKSSLFNALLGEERAIVTEVPGTTRDALEGVVSMGGYPFRLVDTAGLRDTDDADQGQRIEALGIEVARRYLERADLVLLCAEVGEEPGSEERAFVEELEGTPVVLLRTKADLDPGGGSGVAERDVPERHLFSERVADTVPVSVVSGVGLDRLRRVLPTLVYGGLVSASPDAPLLTRRRQSRQARTALDEVRAFASALRRGVPAEVAATHLRPAETALEELLGVVTVDDVLDRVFREFCIGK